MQQCLLRYKTWNIKKVLRPQEPLFRCRSEEVAQD